MSDGFSVVERNGAWELLNPYGYRLYRGTHRLCMRVLDSYRAARG